MVANKEPAMGRFSVEIELANNKDITRAEDGTIKPEAIRQLRIRGVVDSGAARLVIPSSVVQQLGLKVSGSSKVRYADGHTADREIVGEIRLSYGGRNSVFNAIVEPSRESALIGAIVLEDLDLLIDCTSGKLIPRDPKQIVSEIE